MKNLNLFLLLFALSSIVFSSQSCKSTKKTTTNSTQDSDDDGVADDADVCPDIAGAPSNGGCPEVTDEVQNTLNNFAKTILFDSGASKIKEESISVLQSILATLKDYPNEKFVIEGHTDSSGSQAVNQRLSEERANAVKAYLTTNGIDGNRLSAKGYGETKPVADNTTNEGKAKNRRIEINLIKE